MGITHHLWLMRSEPLEKVSLLIRQKDSSHPVNEKVHCFLIKWNITFLNSFWKIRHFEKHPNLTNMLFRTIFTLLIASAAAFSPMRPVVTRPVSLIWVKTTCSISIFWRFDLLTTTTPKSRFAPYFHRPSWMPFCRKKKPWPSWTNRTNASNPNARSTKSTNCWLSWNKPKRIWKVAFLKSWTPSLTSSTSMTKKNARPTKFVLSSRTCSEFSARKNPWSSLPDTPVTSERVLEPHTMSFPPRSGSTPTRFESLVWVYTSWKDQSFTHPPTRHPTRVPKHKKIEAHLRRYAGKLLPNGWTGLFEPL